MTSGLRNPLIPSTGSVRLGLSSDLLSSHDILGRSADGVTLISASDSAFSSSPALMAAHQKAMNSSQLAPPLSSSFFAAGLPSMSSANVSAALSSLSSNGQPSSAIINAMSDANGSTTTNNNYHASGARNGSTFNPSSTNASSGPPPIIQVPSGLTSSGPTLSEAMAMGVDAESLQRAIQNAPQNSGPFNMAHYLQQQRAASQSPSPSQNSGQQSTPVITASGQLRYSGDRFASSAFSPVSPGGTSSASKISSIASYTSTSGGQTPTPVSIIPPLAQMTAQMSPLQFASPNGQPGNNNNNNNGGPSSNLPHGMLPSSMSQSPYTPISGGNPQTPSSYASYDTRNGSDIHSTNSTGMSLANGSHIATTPGGSPIISHYSTPNNNSIGAPLVTTPGGSIISGTSHKRPYLGPNGDPQALHSLNLPGHPMYRPNSGPSSDGSSNDDSRSTNSLMVLGGTPGLNSGTSPLSFLSFSVSPLLGFIGPNDSGNTKHARQEILFPHFSKLNFPIICTFTIHFILFFLFEI